MLHIDYGVTYQSFHGEESCFLTYNTLIKSSKLHIGYYHIHTRMRANIYSPLHYLCSASFLEDTVNYILKYKTKILIGKQKRKKETAKKTVGTGKEKETKYLSMETVIKIYTTSTSTEV